MIVFWIVLAVAIGMMVVECVAGGSSWPHVRGWWWRAILLNGFQVGAASSGLRLPTLPFLVVDPRTRPMYDSVVRYALCGQAPLLRELGVDPAATSAPAEVRLVPRSGSIFGASFFLIVAACQ